MKKYTVWRKNQYKQHDHTFDSHDETLEVLSYFLYDGIGYETYRKFLRDKNRLTKGGNISYLEKKGDMVTISIDPNVLPEETTFTTTIENLLKIINDWERVEKLDAGIIIFEQEDEEVTIRTED